jgi:hypothetical protein
MYLFSIQFIFDLYEHLLFFGIVKQNENENKKYKKQQHPERKKEKKTNTILIKKFGPARKYHITDRILKND